MFLSRFFELLVLFLRLRGMREGDVDGCGGSFFLHVYNIRMHWWIAISEYSSAR